MTGPAGPRKAAKSARAKAAPARRRPASPELPAPVPEVSTEAVELKPDAANSNHVSSGPAVPDTAARDEPQNRAEPETQPEPETRAELETQPEPETHAQPDIQGRADRQAQPEPEGRAELGTQAQREVQALSQPAAPTEPSPLDELVTPIADEAATPTPDQPAKPTPDEPAKPSRSRTRTEAWARLVADPGHAPELLAVAAVQSIGPRAQDWAAAIRDRYPTAAPDAVGRLATRQFARFGRLAALAGAVAGSYAPIIVTAAAALTHAELVLHIAAAYGFDPADEARATDLLVLTGLHPTRASADRELAQARQPAAEGDGKRGDAVKRFARMAAGQAGIWTAIKLINRYYPGTRLLAAALTGRATTDAVAARAAAYYSQESQALGNTV